MSLDSRPLCVDLFCGRGGWARGFLEAGFRVVGFDFLDMSRWYPGEFVRADVRHLDGRRFRNARVIVGSPPCQPFSAMNYKTRDLKHGMVLVREYARVVQEAGVDWCMEEVRGAFRSIVGDPFFGFPILRANPFYFWGTVPPFISGFQEPHYKGILGEPRTVTVKRGPDAGRSWTTTRADLPPAGEAAMVPYPIARALADAILEEDEWSTTGRRALGRAAA
jgi:C-5 cytosine-specific DNA methylase